MLVFYIALRWASVAVKGILGVLGIVAALELWATSEGWLAIILGLMLVFVWRWDTERDSNTAYAIIRQHRAIRATRPPRYREGKNHA